MVQSSHKPLLIATNNRAKQERLTWLVHGSGIHIVTPQDSGLTEPNIREEGPTHERNAQIKAMAWSTVYGGLTIASDGGLVVPALGEAWDSLWTRRFVDRDDAGRARDLVERMVSLKGEERKAYWIEAVALADNRTELATLVAQSGVGYVALDVQSELIKDGFWIGSVWHFPQFDKRYGELTPGELQAVDDHWAKLREKVADVLKRMSKKRT